MTNYVWIVSAGGSISGGNATNAITVTWITAGAQTVSVNYDLASAPTVLNVTVNPSYEAGVTIAASANPVCAGTPVTFTATPSNGGTFPGYQWRVNGVNAGTGPVLTFPPANGDVVTCAMTSNLPCATGNPANSQPISMVVNPNLPVSVNISASANPACVGDMVTFTATPVNGGSQPAFLWKVNGVISGTNSPTFTYPALNGDQVTCTLTSNETCNSGNPAVSNTIIMTMSPVLPVSVSISASANPSCLGAPVTFTATPVNGGTAPVYNWKVNGNSQGSNSATFSYTPVDGEVITCILTSNAGCTSSNPAISNSIAISVIPYASAFINITASANPVCNGTAVTFNATVTNGGSNPQYEWQVNKNTVGTNSAFYTYTPMAGDSVTCQLISNAPCSIGNPAISNTITMTVSPSVVPAISIVASGNPACMGSTVIFTATSSNGGTAPVYLWKVNGVVAGTNSATYSYSPVNGDQVQCILTSNSLCAAFNTVPSNIITISVSAVLPVSMTITTQSNPVCQGTPVIFTATPVNGGTNPSYQWFVGGLLSGTNSNTFSYIPSNNDAVSCILTSNSTCSSGNPATSNTLIMSVSLNLPVSISIAASPNPSCQGQPVTFTAIPVNPGTAPVYVWQVNGVNVGSNSTTFTYAPQNADVVKCSLTSNFTCATGNPASSNQITMVVNPTQVVGISIVSSANPSCNGSAVTYTGSAVNGGTAPVYQWKVNGSNAGSNLSSFAYVPVTGDVITCQLTSNAGCPLVNPVVSNPVGMTVSPVVPAAISITASGNPVCTGTLVTFNATPSNGGTIPVYQWKLNGVNVGGNSSVFTIIPNNGDVITCQLTSNLQCVSGNPVTSDPITMMSSTPLPGTITIFASANPFCQGTPVTFTSSIGNGGTTPSYVWKVNGFVQGGNSPSFTYVPVNGDFVTCQLTSSLTCTTGPVTSNPIYMSMASTLSAGITISASANPVCQGETVLFTAAAVNGGSSPLYIWYVNGIQSGFNFPTYSYIPLNGDVVTCRLTSNATCVSNSPVTSLPVVMIVSNALPAAVLISTLTNPFCTVSSVSFTANPSNGGPAPGYQWFINGNPAGTNSPGFTCNPANGDIITCKMTSVSSCITGMNPVTSNAITMVAAANLPASVTISASSNPVCQGTSVTFTAVPANGGALPAYQWRVNGSNVGSNNTKFTYTPINGDVVSCVLSSSLSCATGNPATSNLISMTVNPIIVASVSVAASLNPTCQGTAVTFTATPTNGGSTPVYQWRVNGLSVGAGLSTYSFTPVNGDVVTCQLTSSAGCTNGIPVISNQVVMSVTAEQPVGVTVTPSQNPFCVGSPVTFTATPVNGGSVPTYLWMVNGIPAGSNNPVYTYIPLVGDIVTCRLTSNKTCINNNPAVSTPVVMVAGAGLPVGVTISPSLNPICQGTLVTFTAVPVNGGPAPVYHWKVNGLLKPSTLFFYQYVPVNGDIITCELISSLSCVTGNPAVSNPVVMTVITSVPVLVTVTASANPSCLGNAVTYTATAVNGGTAPVYQWKVYSSNAGTNSPTFTYTPANGDIITCRVTSNETCTTGNPATSNTVSMFVIPIGPAGVNIYASANPVCEGTTVTYTAIPFNGGTAPVYQWKLNGYIVGTDSATYTYVPLNGDVVTCQMTSNAYCVTSNTVTSNPISMTVSPYLPVGVSITSSSNPVCENSPTTFVASPVNGGVAPVYDWTADATLLPIHTPTLVYTPSNGQVMACKLTSNAGCTLGNPANSNTIPMSVVPNLPVSVSITASSTPPCQGQLITYTATPVNGGLNPSYQWLVNGMNLGGSSPVVSFIPTNGNIISCQLSSSVTCASGNPALSNQIIMNFPPYLPVSVSVTCSANPACAGTSVTYTASPVNGGLNPVYQWKVNGVSAGISAGSYTYFPVNGDVVTCQLTSDVPCPLNNPVLSNSITMAVLVPQVTGVSIGVSVNPACQGTPVTFTATGTNGGSTPAYQWYLNGITTGTNSPLFTFTPANGDVVSCQLTSSISCVTSPAVMSNSVTMAVSTDLPASIAISATANPACQGQVVTYTASPVNGGPAPVFVWRNKGIVVGTNSTAYTYTPTNGDIISCQMFSSYSCSSGSPATSNLVPMVVNPNLPVSISITGSSNPACVATPITFNAFPVNGGSSPGYQWIVNGVNVGANLPAYTYQPANGDLVSCQVASNATCISGNPAISNQVNMIIGSSFPVTVTISASDNPICQMTPVTFTATSSFGGPSPTYQWKNKGVNVGSNSTTYSYFPSQGDTITCVMTSQLTCGIGNPATSNAVIMTVLPIPVSITISATPAGSVCAGSPVTFAGFPINGGATPTFQWKVNGLGMGTNSATFTYPPQDGDFVTCTLTSNATCASGNTVTSAGITTSVLPNNPVSITIVSTLGNTFCSGSAATFTATLVNGGSSPLYDWKVNGITAATGTPSFTYFPVNSDAVTCTLTSDVNCATGNPAVSNTVVLTVNPSLPVGVSITAAPSGPVCAGTTVTFTSVSVNGGASPAYQWKVNGIIAGLNSPVFSYVPSNGDMVTCEITSTVTCPVGNPAVSNTITMTVNPVLPVGISIMATPPGAVCSGSSLTFSATPVNGGTIPVYQWYVNGVIAGTNSPVFVYVPSSNDQVKCALNSSETCKSGNPAMSGTLTVIVNPTLPVGVAIAAFPGNTVCAGTTVSYTATPVNGGLAPAYQWFVNGALSGTNSPNFSYTPVNNDAVYCTVTSSAVCPTGNPAASNTVTMTVNPVNPVGITLAAAPAGAVCAGTPVTFTATGSNAGAGPAYQWTVNGANAGGNSTIYTYLPANGDIIGCVLTSNVSCPSGNPATAIPVIASVVAIKPVSVVISANPGNVACAGTLVTVTASGMNGGATPGYQWYLNGAASGTNSPAFSFTPVSGDAVSVTYTSVDNCVSNNPATSNSIGFTVNPLLPVSVTILDNPPGPVCAGTPVTFTATPVNGGGLPAYQWQVNGVNQGTNSPVFTYVPLNGESITCKLTSSATCATGSPAWSASIIKTVIPNVPVSVSITANPAAAVCPGTLVTYTALPANGGVTPLCQWKVNGINAGAGGLVYSYIPVIGDVVTCILTSSITCTTGNPAISNPITVALSPTPVVTFTTCNDLVTTADAKPFVLKGGLPLGGIYSGAGVNPATGMFDPAAAGTGNHILGYSYTNAGLCSSSAARNISVQAVVPFTCGNNFTDPRDNRAYPTILVGARCWFAKNLDYGTMSGSLNPQTDNCTVEKYCPNDLLSNCTTYGGFYQWDELMGYNNASGAQGLCPPAWHVPTTAEWLNLFSQYNQQSEASQALRTILPGGFNALLPGILLLNNSWVFNTTPLEVSFFWTSDLSGATRAMAHGLNNQTNSVSDYPSSRANGITTRCIRD